jgi:hypothetical protein
VYWASEPPASIAQPSISPTLTTAPTLASTDATNPIAGQWSGNISSQDGTFSTPVELSIQTGCKPGQVCGTFSAPQIPCSGDLALQTITGGTFLFVEQNVAGGSTCPSGGYEQLQIQMDGSLSYQYLAILGLPAMSTGILAPTIGISIFIYDLSANFKSIKNIKRIRS